jgi:hypothetical protein
MYIVLNRGKIGERNGFTFEEWSGEVMIEQISSGGQRRSLETLGRAHRKCKVG